MVWVLNGTSDDIIVSITNTSGGDPGQFLINPTSTAPPNWANNHWQRSASETINVALTNGKTYNASIEPDYQVTIYADTAVVIHVKHITNF